MSVKDVPELLLTISPSAQKPDYAHRYFRRRQALLSGPADQPVVMVNLLRFKRVADAPNASVSGEDAYGRYAEKMIAFVESKGGRVIWSGTVDSQVIGEGGDNFHMVGLVEYPSRKAFTEIATDPYVQEIGVHRASGLEGQWLLAATSARV